MIKVLTANYEIIKLSEPDKFMIEYNLQGYCSYYEKKIYVLFPETGSEIQKERELNEVLRHELLHAFLYECGLGASSDWAENEEIVDWMAIQFPKIAAMFTEAGCNEKL